MEREIYKHTLIFFPQWHNYKTFYFFLFRQLSKKQNETHSLGFVNSWFGNEHKGTVSHLHNPSTCPQSSSD